MATTGGTWGRHRWRVVAGTAALGLVLLVAAGCSSSASRSTPAPSKPTTTTTTDPLPQFNAATDADFVAVVRGLPVLAGLGLDDSGWIDLGHEVCTNIHRGDVAKGHGQGIVQEHLVLISRANSQEWETGAPQAIMASATGILCPQYAKRWAAYLAQNDWRAVAGRAVGCPPDPPRYPVRRVCSSRPRHSSQ